LLATLAALAPPQKGPEVTPETNPRPGTRKTSSPELPSCHFEEEVGPEIPRSPKDESGPGKAALFENWSGWLESNQRPPAPEAGQIRFTSLRSSVRAYLPERTFPEGVFEGHQRIVISNRYLGVSTFG